MRPSYVISNARRISQRFSQSFVLDQTDNVTKLDSGFVRKLLLETLATIVLQRQASGVGNIEFKYIVKFCLNSGKLEELDQCWVLRLDDNTVRQLYVITEINEDAKQVYYLVDKSGYDTLKGLVPGLPVNPDSCRFQGIKITKGGPSFNIQPSNSTAMDRIVRAKLGPNLPIQTYPEEHGAWIANVTRYSTTKALAVDFHRTLPTIALTNQHNTFISFEACDTLLVMLWTIGELLQIADKLGMYVLGANQNYYKPLAEMTCSWPVEERFLHCLLRLVNGKSSDLEDILHKKLNAEELEVKDAIPTLLIESICEKHALRFFEISQPKAAVQFNSDSCVAISASMGSGEATTGINIQGCCRKRHHHSIERLDIFWSYQIK
jgi:hypothetical protein